MALRIDRNGFLFLGIVFTFISIVYADGKNLKKFEIKKKKGENTLLLSFDYTEIFDQKAQQNLSSGLPSVVLLRLGLNKVSKNKPVKIFIRTCKIVYDIWEENYVVNIYETTGNKTEKCGDRKNAISICASPKNMKFSIDGVESGTYYFSATVDLNPLSDEVLESMRKWLKRPLSDSGSLNPSDSFFGSFMTLFVNEKIQPSEKTFFFESQKFKL